MTEIQVHKLIKLLEKLKKDTEGHELNWGETSDLRDLSRNLMEHADFLFWDFASEE